MGALFVFLGVFFLLAILVKIPVGFSLGIGATATFLYAHLPVINMAHKVRFLHLTVPLIWRFRSL